MRLGLSYGRERRTHDVRRYGVRARDTLSLSLSIHNWEATRADAVGMMPEAVNKKAGQQKASPARRKNLLPALLSNSLTFVSNLPRTSRLLNR